MSILSNSNSELIDKVRINESVLNESEIDYEFFGESFESVLHEHIYLQKKSLQLLERISISSADDSTLSLKSLRELKLLNNESNENDLDDNDEYNDNYDEIIILEDSENERNEKEDDENMFEIDDL